MAQWIGRRISDQGVPGSIPRRCTFRCGLEQVTFTLCLVLVKPRKRWTDDPTWTDCDEAGDYVVPNVLSPRDLVSRPDIMDETVPHMFSIRDWSDGKAKTRLNIIFVSICSHYVNTPMHLQVRLTVA